VGCTWKESVEEYIPSVLASIITYFLVFLSFLGGCDGLVLDEVLSSRAFTLALGPNEPVESSYSVLVTGNQLRICG
jgi:hypothetical protein